MADTGAPPVIPSQFQQYNSYVVDPQWQRKFSIIWPSFLAFFFFLSLPHLVRSAKNGRVYAAWIGISEDCEGTIYQALPTVPSSATICQPMKKSALKDVETLFGRFRSIFYWTLPGIGLNAGQMFIITAYITTVILCIVLKAPLIDNSNRAGFIALAQFPIVFLFATKNSVVSLLLGPGNGYEKLNYIHRWSGRLMFFGGLLHGALWIRNHLEFGIAILGQQKETSGIAALSLLGIIVLSSLRVVRRFAYEVFFIVHMLSYVAFFVTICYHTIYASPWIFPPLAFYGLDILLRMFRHRIKDAVIIPVGSQMTLIHIPYATHGWLAGQHVRLRVFFSARVFESHPLTIFSAPPDTTCITSMPAGISLGARTVGNWTNALNAYAREAGEEIRQAELLRRTEKGTAATMTKTGEQQLPVEVPTQVMIDGPYGGCSLDLGQYETALLFAGGSGITFALGMLDDIVGRCVRKGRHGGEKTRRIEVAWCIRSFGSIDWFAPALMDIATVAASSANSPVPLHVHISIYVTCLCNPEAIPPIPNCDVTIIRPSIYKVLLDLITPPGSGFPSSTSKLTETPPNIHEKPMSEDAECEDTAIVVESDESASPSANSKLPWIGQGGGVAVCASGPESLTREASNAVARMQMSAKGRALGGVGLHTEVFSL